MSNYLKVLIVVSLILFNTNISLSQNQSTIDSLLSVLNTNISNKDKVDTYIKIANEYNDSTNITFYTESALKLVEKLNYQEDKIEVIDIITLLYERSGNYSDAINIFNRLIKESKSPKIKLYSLNRLGDINKFLGNYENALNYYFQTCKIAQKLDKKLELSLNYNKIGTIYYVQGQYEKALDFYHKELEIVTRLNDKKNAINVFTGIGIVYYSLGEYEKAINNHNKALKNALAINDKLQESVAYGNLADIYYKFKNYDKALKYVFHSLAISRELENTMGVSSCYIQIGLMYEEQKNYKDALKYYKKSIALVKESNAIAELAFPLISIGRILRKKNELKSAKKYLTEGLQIARERGLIEEVKNAAEQLSFVEYELGNSGSAFKTYILFKTMDDSLQNEELTRKIARLEAEYDFNQEKDSIQFVNKTERINLEKDIEKRKILQLSTFLVLGLLLISMSILFSFFQSKKRSNQLLLQKTKELKVANGEIVTQKKEILIQNEQLQEINNLKNRVFSIIAHDLRSPINNLKSVLVLMNTEGLLSIEEQNNIINKLNNNLLFTSDLLDNLLFWAKSQMQGNLVLSPKNLIISKYIDEVISLFGDIAKTKGLTTNVILAEKKEITGFVDPEILRFLLRNILNNAYKFSFENSEVVIEIISEKNHIKIVVTDSGIGMDKIKKQQLFSGFVESQRGTHSEKGTGLGLMLCKELVEKSGGAIGVESELGNGSKFWFVIPVAPNMN